MTNIRHLSLQAIEPRVCDLVAEQLRLPREEVHPDLRLIQDLHCDSLDAVELLMEIEEAFGVSLPDDPPSGAYKSVFTRSPFRLRDLAELVYLQQGNGLVRRRGWWGEGPSAPADPERAPFTQLGGVLSGRGDGRLFERLGKNGQGLRTYRRRTDGMVCVALPEAEVQLGSAGELQGDESPPHRARLSTFLIDCEPVSTTAYCRFLNSVDLPDDRTTLERWFLLTADDKRHVHQLLRHGGSGWSPLSGVERLPMMLVSWYGANAYARWANGREWWRDGLSDDDEEAAFLPTEAQWEYAARGPEPRRYPWGDEAPTPERMRYAQHRPGRAYAADDLPMADVNAGLGVSPFGLRHMAGNVWQWCRDWYAPDFYARAEASAPDPANRKPTRVRSERGGSWVGPESLCRSSYRRGRVPTAKGRCLGFRCVGCVEEARSGVA